MQKISINRYKIQKNLRLRTSQNQGNLKIDRKQKIIYQNKRYSCLESDWFPQNKEQTVNKSNKKSVFHRHSQIQQKDNFLKNILQSNERKRFQILNNMINSKRKLFSSVNKVNQNFKKMIKIKTPQKQNQSKDIKLITERDKISSRNNLFINNFNEKLRLQQRGQKNFLFSQRKRPQVKLSSRQSQILKNNFNQRIKEIKLRKYFQKDELQTNQINLFQAYGASIIGQKHAENQDSIYFSQGNYVLCDGHGTNGKQISSFICETVHNHLAQCLEQNKIDETIILETYRKIDLQLQNSSFQVSFSGCTCVALLRFQNTLFCISLGDSRAILSRGYNVTQISVTQKPDKPQQKERILNYGGVVRQTQVSKDKFSGPMRIWAPGKNSWGPGLGLSRAFGDKASRKYGVISVPEITRVNLTSEEQFIVIGSDGLFDFFGDQQICHFIKKLLKDDLISKEDIPNELINEAKKKWSSDSDDISCIIIFI